MKTIILVFAINCHVLYVHSQIDSSQHRMSPPDIDTTSKDFLINDKNEDGTILNRERNNYENLDLNKDKKDSIPNNTNKYMSGNTDPIEEQDGIMLKNGKMMIMENGEIKMLNNEIIMKNGIKVKSNGIIVIKDGSKMRMNEGEHIDMSGNLILRKDSIQNRKK